MIIIIYAHFKFDIFIMMIYNFHWFEITIKLWFYQSFQNHINIIARIFKLKLNALINDFIKNEILEKIIDHMYIIEFQKRELLYVHIFLFCNILINHKRLKMLISSFQLKFRMKLSILSSIKLLSIICFMISMNHCRRMLYIWEMKNVSRNI